MAGRDDRSLLLKVSAMSQLTRQVAGISVLAIFLWGDRSLPAQIPAVQLTAPLRRALETARPQLANESAQAANSNRSEEPTRPNVKTLKDAEIAILKADYDKMSQEDQEAMVAVYKDLGIDLRTAMGLNASEAEAAAGAKLGTDPKAAATKNDLLKAIRKLNFARTPDKVLEARAQIGLKATPMPSDKAAPDELASWLHSNVIAGEWNALQVFLSERAGNDAVEIYAHVLQSTNQGDPGLLPEEILAISEACPAELSDWQLSLLAQLLKTASSRSSTGPLLEKLRNGTTFFGPQDDGRRERTAKFLSEAALVVDAYDYLPNIDRARERSNTEALTSHARYHEARAKELGTTPQAQSHQRTAWDLYGEIALMDKADFATRRQAMGQAIELLPSIPPGPATHWLQTVFASKALAATGLEAVALKAARIGNEKISIQERASAILMMKESVDALLTDESIEIEQLRIPLRLLTMSLVAAAEETITKLAGKAGVAPETTLLLRALPGDKWRSTIEPSLAVRAFKAFIGISLSADNVDMALDLLSKGIQRAPGQSIEMADEFLRVWMLRLNPQPDPRRTSSFIILAGRQQTASAPLTRGRQDRNLDRLRSLLDLLDAIGANGRSLDRVVTAFSSCHGKAETFRRENVISVLGPIDQLAPAVAARLAESMRTGLNGDWRSREAQKAAGTQRSDSEIEALIEAGYQLALELIGSALHHQPDSWRYAMTKAALAYDHMQFRKERDQDAAAYNRSRRDLFQAFGDAAKQYQAAVIRGELREDPGVYLTWFSIALGSSDLRSLKADDLLTEGAENNDQMQLIRNQILEMPAEMAASHLGEFARRITDELPNMVPEVKPGLVRRANEIVGDHPQGALLRQTLDLYNDLLRNELYLHVAIDGNDQVGTKPFGATISLRYTAAIGRELGGFNQYLQNNVYTYIAGRYQPTNFRDRFEKTLNQAFSDELDLVHLGFFDSMNPAKPIQVDGKSGWEEKPLCYLVLRAKDPSVDRLPLLQMDINTMDEAGMVVLPIHSNRVLIDATDRPHSNGPVKARPILDLNVVQTIDTRGVISGQEDVIKFEVSATGRGVLPELEDLFEDLDKSIPGYQWNKENIETETLQVAGVSTTGRSSVYDNQASESSDAYVEADADGLFRLSTTRKWIIRFEPSSMATENRINVPRLSSALTGTLTTERYVDMELVPVEAETMLIQAEPHSKTALIWGIVGALVLLSAIAVIWIGKGNSRSRPQDNSLKMPSEITPFSAVITLQRFAKHHSDKMTLEDRGRLLADIANIERAYFGIPPDSSSADPQSTVVRWHQFLSRLA